MSGAFSGLSDRLNHIFSKMKNKGKLSELEIKQAMREVRVALLEADVNYAVAKDFIAKVTEKATGEDILNSLTPVQQVIKVVNEELIELMGTPVKLQTASKPPTIIMMCGLQGAGKTTMSGKLGYYLKKQGKKPLLVACDIYRPAAIKQLQIVGEKAGVPVFEMGTEKPEKIVKEALKLAEKSLYDTVIIDTAGRLHIDEALMGELAGLKKAYNPDEILLVIDSMLGQDAVTVADTFNKQLEITGVALTKLDGDTRGGAALSVRAVTGKPIKFSGVGEKIEDLEVFHPERMASRILGMGDVLTLIEKAQNAYSEEEALLLEKKFREQSYTLDDYVAQFDKIGEMGGMSQMLSMLPGVSNKMKSQDMQFDEQLIVKNKAIVSSMTKKERDNPNCIKASHKKRIATGSGTTIQDVNKLLKTYDQTKLMMKRFAGGGKKGMKLPF